MVGKHKKNMYAKANYIIASDQQMLFCSNPWKGVGFLLTNPWKGISCQVRESLFSSLKNYDSNYK